MKEFSIYRPDVPPCVHLDILGIVALAKIGAAATDSNLNVDLESCGYLHLFETIAAQANALLDKVPD